MRAVIRKDGIYHELRGPLWSVLLCKLGLHRWSYWHMAPSFIEMCPDQANVCRHCLRCWWTEMTFNGRTWRGRV